MTVRECISKLTYREYYTTLAWLDLEWDMPDRADFYRMQIALEVVRSNSKNPNAVNLQDMILPFRVEPPDKKKKRMSDEELKDYNERMTEQAKSIWRSRLEQAGKAMKRVFRKPEDGDRSRPPNRKTHR